MDMFIRIYYKGHFKDISLSNHQRLFIGSDAKDGFSIPGSDLKKEHIKLVNKNGTWEISCIGEVLMNGSKITRETLIPEQIFVLSRKERISMMVIPTYAQSGMEVKLPEELAIGRGEKNNIVLDSPIVSGKHAKIKRMGTDYHLIDMGSMNGTYVNENAVKECVLKNGDEIVIGEAKFIYGDDRLEIYGVNNHISVHEAAPKQKNVKQRPIYKRSPRLKLEMPNEKIDIQNPPSIGSKPNMNWISVLTYPLIMLIPTIIAFITTKSLQITGIFALAMPISGVLSYRLQTKKYRKDEKLRIEKYKQYLADIQKQIDGVHAKQLRALCAANPDTKDCTALVKEMSPKMWERSPLDDDFMRIRIGNGKVPSVVEIKTPNETLSLHEDTLSKGGQKIADDNRYVENAPILCDIKNHCMVGVVGDRKNTVALAKNIVMQAATTHSYEELKIVTVFPKKEYSEWEWIRWLPHSFDDGRAFRFMASNSIEVSELCRRFEDIVKERKSEIEENSYGRKTMQLPYYLFVIADDEDMKKQGIMKTLRACEYRFGMGAVILTHSKNELYMECKEIIELRNDSGVIYNAENSGEFEAFHIDKVDAKSFDLFARLMAPIRVEEKAKATALPSCVTFLDGYHVKTPDQIPVAENWKKALPFRSMSVPVGIRENGERFMFDIYEKKHGP